MSSSALVLEYHLISCTRALALAKGKILLASGEGWKQARLSLQNETSGLVSKRRGDFITVLAWLSTDLDISLWFFVFSEIKYYILNQ